MMKKWIAVLLACLMLLAAAALAEDVESAIRGKTLIIRMPDAWIQEKIQDAAPHVGWWDDDGQNWSWKSPASEWMLSLFIMNGSAPVEGSAILPAYMYGGEMEMSLNRIGESWYAVLRLEEASDSKDIQYELCNVDYGISDMGVLTAKEESCVTVEMALNPQDMSAMQPDFTARYDNIKISLFPALGATVAVIVEENADKDLLQEVQMLVDYSCGPLLNGYMDGEDAVYCCMVSDETAQDIRSGAQVKFLRPSFARDADFENTAYAAVQKGTGDWGIINTSGEWVVEPQYSYISRPDPERNRWDTPRYFLCRSEKDGMSLTVRHGETMQVIAELPGESENGGNPAVFTTYTNDGTNVYSVLTGEKLFSTNGGFAVFESGETHYWVCPEYVYSVQGYPERLVIQMNGIGSKDAAAYLADNHGKRITGNYFHILPLIWANDKGVYLTQQGEGFVLEAASSDFYDYEYSGDDPMWRCGLMDENGNTIADCTYTGVRILSREEIWLEEPDGDWVSFRWME